ncbi:hypothetical protein EVAR_11448_1 [Eumeta japonica]|uniref:Uncharacterized protein n=1 Tax=Eumeta variegata TaxID=151549 RepID=A0A4C1TNH7_EUMVA|nr:hypothetical protein EVAR_11448_1 [Eumeta japonica]
MISILRIKKHAYDYTELKRDTLVFSDCKPQPRKRRSSLSFSQRSSVSRYLCRRAPGGIVIYHSCLYLKPPNDVTETSQRSYSTPVTGCNDFKFFRSHNVTDGGRLLQVQPHYHRIISVYTRKMMAILLTRVRSNPDNEIDGSRFSHLKRCNETNMKTECLGAGEGRGAGQGRRARGEGRGEVHRAIRLPSPTAPAGDS